MEGVRHYLRRFGVILAEDFKKTFKTTFIYGTPLAGGFYYYTHTYEPTVGGVVKVEGPSMQPTLNSYLVTSWGRGGNDQTLVGNSRPSEDWVWYERQFDLSRGDVVIVRDPEGRGRLVKRVIGLQGDTVTPLGFNNSEREAVTLGVGQVWIESDTGGFGFRDSHKFGPVARELVEAKVTYNLGNWKEPHWRWREVESVVPEKALGRLKTAPTFATPAPASSAPTSATFPVAPVIAAPAPA